MSCVFTERGSYASYNYHSNMINQYDNRFDYQQDIFMQRGSMMYSTLPSRKPPKVYQPERESIRRYSPQTVTNYHGTTDYYGYNSLPRRPLDYKNKDFSNQYPQNTVPKLSNIMQNQVPSNLENTRYINFQSSTPNKDQIGNSSKLPLGISNFFSPIRKTQPVIKEKIDESFKISPIEPCNSAKFQTSTPQKPINSAINLTNRLLSPKKSTMSNEELYAVIHRSKKKLNIKTDFTNAEPSSEMLLPKNNDKQPETGYLKPQSRCSWSPNNEDISKNLDALSLNPGSRQSWACNDRLGTKTTSRLDFKKLLLQQSSKTPSIRAPGNKLSAVEQLRLSKEQSLPKKSQFPLQIADLSASPKNLSHKKFNVPTDTPTSPEKQRVQPKIMSPRSAWRFANPRSDVLSSTILEDCREDETSNSSNELNNSPKYLQEKLVQNSVANCNTISEASKQIFLKNDVLQNELHGKSEFCDGKMTRSQYIQARREAYFNSVPITNIQNNVRASPPTLETAL